MKHVPIAKFKDRMSEFIAEAEAGDEILLTRHGKVAARIVPPEVDKAELRKQAFEKIRSFRASIKGRYNPVSSADIEGWLDESRP